MDHNTAPHSSPSSRSRRSAPRPRLTVTSPPDLVAAVAVALGFVPTESVVMLVLAPASGPHARIDLPYPREGEEGVRSVARVLAAAGIRNHVDQVALVVFAEHHRAMSIAPGLATTMAAAGIEVTAFLGADGASCLEFVPSTGEVRGRDRGGSDLVTQPYEVLAHPFVARAVADGLPVRRDRSELEEMIAPQGDAVSRVASHTCPRCLRAQQSGPGPSDAERIRGWTRRGARFPSTRDEHLVACLLKVLDDAARAGDSDVRDATWSWVHRSEAARHVDLWVAVVRAAPVGRAVQAASVLAFHAWLAGQGALAWCALDRVAERGGSSSLATLVRDLMERSVPPHSWDPLTAVEVVSDAGASTSVVPLRGATTTPPV
ncbi:DUF4192 domain-containing protein [Nocardioides yefusunii]|uniref:DUF4192 domain-containing protein n=1 Tax=Nocardioides yefusunii TaxID=2500546 RepID=A0ABW1QXG6_9ACTN|nr:DUF4192 domain-containing protein [Nocardioides yefusunii]